MTSPNASESILYLNICFGFGQHLSDTYPHLFETIADDKPSSVGFNLVSACIGLAIKDMDKLPKRTEKLDQSLLEECILEATQFVDDTLKSILSVRQHGRKKISIYHTEYQIISMIATAFQIRYETGNLSEIEGWKTNRDKLEKHIVMYYLYDILRGHWKGSGDSTLQDTVSNLRYLNAPPSKAAWENILGAWFTDEQIPLAHKGRYVSLLTKPLRFSCSNTFMCTNSLFSRMQSVITSSI